MGTHQELEMFGSQPAYPEKLLHKKESLQNQLINIRVELSQASTVRGSPSTMLPIPIPAPFPVPVPIRPSRSSRQSSVPVAAAQTPPTPPLHRLWPTAPLSTRAWRARCPPCTTTSGSS